MNSQNNPPPVPLNISTIPAGRRSRSDSTLAEAARQFSEWPTPPDELVELVRHAAREATLDAAVARVVRHG